MSNITNKADKDSFLNPPLKNFIQSEIDLIEQQLEEMRLAKACNAEPTKFDMLYAARQALGWALNPVVYRSPFTVINGIEDDQSNGLGNALITDFYKKKD
jgi:hypothetical protein